MKSPCSPTVAAVAVATGKTVNEPLEAWPPEKPPGNPGGTPVDSGNPEGTAVEEPIGELVGEMVGKLEDSDP